MIPDMAVHTIMLPVAIGDEFSDALRSIVWDDEAGTVEGDHGLVPAIRGILARDRPVTVGTPGGTWDLRDPGRDPVEMLTILGSLFWPSLDDPLRSTLPPVFNGIEVAPPEPGEIMLDYLDVPDDVARMLGDPAVSNAELDRRLLELQPAA